ncbi:MULTISPECIES: tRNA (adenosine(37)-N6)-threonylcarbamoyltransferase complex ATPase subunit type 1 TsaE [Cyanophyceae]|uniref:tRNA (adenosine(37)-N6)-threonylcarbamoyltransferase complex ATPase subunit type 1 TsaE n=1 Tax=Cyanophyceae TaxID=3028117 RepID=UPI0016854B61|nr:MULTISPECIES: tRNA (adenosine(37)-N6)-threonylcarbamoyltransferase complex ATPase subunit type 1 TsaE [Cyanophyceae]MBD1915993.1 tRNA (adenosine(37)-N6)-threonylcarbamoyltransferase complex ATPase subunit type 1 TsaE [Phormidium sp. FACHB-77]MBD2031738.1 tRNA (adenosine(37)-N6)-threonylcarbamoyltransferase complex ATPase subunit type 1 TsaE [Phormidium sp. FACHB-322]MBD2052635.1 tRNA (adenosine(37)-N6)-threonylcarbamoyltransferase complex ATPase subunit type 1 TsaE [Leptolyngbya sp. FACHB-60]
MREIFSFVVDLSDSRATHDLGYKLGQSCPSGTILLLFGDLGSGKTTLVQGLGAGLGIIEPISSPTFTLINEYLEGRVPLYHVDLYRLEMSQVDSLELEESYCGGEALPGVLAVEWAERMGKRPQSAISLRLEHVSTGGRQATLMACGDAQVALLKKVIGDGLLVDEV